jgi:hypothetical protein
MSPLVLIVAIHQSFKISCGQSLREADLPFGYQFSTGPVPGLGIRLVFAYNPLCGARHKCSYAARRPPLIARGSIIIAQYKQYVGIEKTVYSPGPANLQAVAVDSNGVVYIADMGNSCILIENPSGLGYLQTILVSNTPHPIFSQAIAVDASFNVYIADAANNQLFMETSNGGS